MRTSNLKLGLVVLFACLFLALPATAEVSLRGNTVSVSGNTVTFDVADRSVGYDLKVTGDEGFLYEERFEAGSLMSWTAAGVDDGLYKYELVPVAAHRERGRDAEDSTPVAETLSGSIRVEAGSLANPDRPEKLTKDIVHADDVIANFSLCVGTDCVNGESFGFDTVRLKENNLRIHFDDTSNSGSFPSNDWRLIANDSANGGANYFAIEDSTAGRIPFRVEAGARANALYVESDGDIGIGTANPAVDLEIETGNTPTLRLNQDGSSGFTSQVWDVAGNEANFFVRDVTNGSKLSFRIEPGTPQDALYLDSTGNVGMGTNGPAEALHVRRTDAAVTLVKIENANASPQNTGLRIDNGGATGPWDIRENTLGQLTVNLVNTGVVMTVDDASPHNVTLAGGLITSGGGGACTTGDPCDGVFAPDFVVPSIEEHAAEMWENSYLPAVGPTLPNQPINITEKTTGMLNELEKAHIYIEQLNLTIKGLEARLEKLEAKTSE